VSSTLTEQPSACPPHNVTECNEGYPTSDDDARSLAAQLKAAAVRLCGAGWPILPVSYPTADRLVSGRCPPDEDAAADWWSDQPYGIACRTGELFDALQVPSWLGRMLLPAVEHYATVVEVATALETAWLFLVTPNSPGIPDLPRDIGIRLRGAGDWILVPPTPTLGGTSRWVARPPEQRLAEQRLPHSLTLQWSVVRAVSSARRLMAEARRPRGQG
jgi:hypothetical protein